MTTYLPEFKTARQKHSAVKTYPQYRLATFLLVSFLIVFPKGGVKVGDIPITWGYLLLPVIGVASFIIAGVSKDTICSNYTNHQAYTIRVTAHWKIPSWLKRLTCWWVIHAHVINSRRYPTKITTSLFLDSWNCLVSPFVCLTIREEEVDQDTNEWEEEDKKRPDQFLRNSACGLNNLDWSQKKESATEQKKNLEAILTMSFIRRFQTLSVMKNILKLLTPWAYKETLRLLQLRIE